jgi:hypothetical protein
MVAPCVIVELEAQAMIARYLSADDMENVVV